MKQIILATSNTGKIAELRALLSPVECISQRELGIFDAPETGGSFIENAILKARNASAQSGKPALADDSGLVVHALDGAPGIYSARFAGPNATDDENIDYLLRQLLDVPIEKRHAFFYCAIAFITHEKDPTPVIATGMLPGLITRDREGHQGFGYDPIFYLPNQQCTLAQLSSIEKNKISHRSQALKQLKTQLEYHVD